MNHQHNNPFPVVTSSKPWARRELPTAGLAACSTKTTDERRQSDGTGEMTYRTNPTTATASRCWASG